MRRSWAFPVVFGLAAALLAAGTIGVVRTGRSGSTPRADGTTAAGRTASTDRSAAATVKLEAQLRRTPANWLAWAALGSAYIQQGRLTADPTYYPRAQVALQRSLQLSPRDNDAAMSAMGALAAARHDFAGALTWSQRASRVNSYNANTYGVAGDALIELGRYPEAFGAVQRMVDLRPGLSSFARASYAWELRGDVPRARAALERALRDANTPADVAFANYYLGELAWNSGDLAGASTHYTAGYRADPSYLPLLQGQAKVAAARGSTNVAVRDYTTVVARLPQPQYVIELGDLYASLGRQTEATRAYDLVRVEQKLFAANGVNADLELALFDADHGDPAGALRAARAEWGRRHSVFVADALGWALHRVGHDAEALTLARTATGLGMRNALFYYHLGMIENSLGRSQSARADLARALAYNPSFNLLQAQVARRTLAEIPSPAATGAR